MVRWHRKKTHETQLYTFQVISTTHLKFGWDLPVTLSVPPQIGCKCSRGNHYDCPINYIFFSIITSFTACAVGNKKIIATVLERVLPGQLALEVRALVNNCRRLKSCEARPDGVIEKFFSPQQRDVQCVSDLSRTFGNDLIVKTGDLDVNTLISGGQPCDTAFNNNFLIFSFNYFHWCGDTGLG